MSPEILMLLKKMRESIEEDLNLMHSLMERKKAQYVKLTTEIMMIEGDLDAMGNEHITINCDPVDMDDEGRLIGGLNDQ